MKTKTQKFDLYNNERGFTLVELLVASAVSIVLLGVLANVMTHQGNSFEVQNQLNTMQTNGRATTEFLARAVQNAGYNVFRGTRFLAASDHYLTAVYDQDNDGIIQNDEVMTFAPGNGPAGPGETFNINPFFDRDGDGEVAGTETATFPISMTLTAPPYNMYKVIPDNTGTGVTRHLMARNIDNVVIRYYDRNDNPLPLGVAVDGNGLPIPPFNFAATPSELNDIRRVDVQVLARTKDPHPKNINFPQGQYVTGSVATVPGINTYDDAFYRETFTANQSPRNLVMAPWGKMDVAANPHLVNCPIATTTVTATLVDSVGDPLPAGTSINFVASAGGTVNPVVNTTNGLGEATTTVTYDWSAPSASITVSANSLITVAGEQYPVFSASSANFQSGTGSFNDTFNGGLDVDWGELDNPADIDAIDTDADTIDDAMIMAPSGLFTRTVNGCSWQKYQVEFELTPSVESVPGANDGFNDLIVTPGGFVGGYLRYENQNSNYSFLVVKQAGGNCLPGDGKSYCLRFVYWDGANQNPIGPDLGIDFIDGVQYKLLAQVEDDFLRVKFWNPLALEAGAPLGLADPNPGNWDYTDGTFVNVFRKEFQDPGANIASGQIGLIGTGFIGANVIFDNFSVTPLN
jgi:type II secretory pathway pseudopilin PulG